MSTSDFAWTKTKNNTQKIMTKPQVIALITFLIVVIAIQAHILIRASEIEVDNPEPVCTSLECEVARRTITMYEASYDDNMERARLEVLLEMNKEMQEMTTNPDKRLNK